MSIVKIREVDGKFVVTDFFSGKKLFWTREDAESVLMIALGLQGGEAYWPFGVGEREKRDAPAPGKLPFSESIK